MSAFTEKELGYLAGQPLGRLATVDDKGEPHVVPVSFRHNLELDTIDVGGHNLSASKKFRDVAASGKVAFVVDDVLPPGALGASRCAGGRRRSGKAGNASEKASTAK